MKIVSWNVNGIRAATKNGMWTWFKKYKPDILLLQEIKALPEQVEKEILNPAGYNSIWMPAEKKGYSGVAAYFKEAPLNADKMGIPEFDSEGRVQILKWKNFSILNAYFPNSQEAGKRLTYKLGFCDEILKIGQDYRKKKKNLIICGDYNIAHKPIDLKNPKSNEKNPGYLPEEREWMTKFLDSGFVDIFREFEPGPDHYTWWSYRMNARERNVGWRIDYHCANQEFLAQVKKIKILNQVMGSDHCPVMLEV